MATSPISSRMERRRQQLEKDVASFLDGSRTTPLNVPSLLDPYQTYLDKMLKNVEVNVEEGLHQHEQWVTLHLPAITEAVFRTKHLETRTHVQAAQKLFQTVLRLVALGLTLPASSPAATCLPALLDLLLLLMDGSPSKKYAEPLIASQLAASAPKGPKSSSNYDVNSFYQSKISTKFYKEHGKPRVFYLRNRAQYFWEDDPSISYGEDQVGWHLEILNLQQGTQWSAGIVKEYSASTNEHLVKLENGKSLKLQLKRYDIRWKGKGGSSSSKRDVVELEGARLKDSEDDIGVRVKIFWHKYNKYYAGYISAFDPSTCKHEVTYDDGDCRIYDMSRKVFSILAEASPKASQQASGGDHFPSTSESPEPANPNEPAEELFATRPPAAQGYSTSFYLIENINHFGRLGGFTSLTERLFDPKSRFIELLAAVKVVYAIRSYLTSEATQALVWDLKEAGPRLLVNLADAELKEMGKDDLAGCIEILKGLVVSAGDGDGMVASVEESIARLNLDLTYRQFTSNQLEKRLNGLTQIKEIVEAVQAKERTGGASRDGRQWGSSTGQQVRTSRNQPKKIVAPSWATPSFMRRWLLKSGLVAQLFGPSMHVELVKRAGPILSFLATQGALRTKELEAIWTCAAGRHHEATTRVLYDLIGDLVPVLRPRPRAFLFSLIASLPIARYDEQALHLIYHFTVKALEARRASEGEESGSSAATSGVGASGGAITPPTPRESELAQGAVRKGQVVNCPTREWFGFGLIWTFLQDLPIGGPTAQEESVSKEMTELGMTLLVQLLQEREVSVERGPLIQKCLENLRAHRSVPVTLQVLVRTVSTQPQQQRGFFSRGKDTSMCSVLEGLENSNQLMELFFKDLDHYHQELRSRYGPSLGLEGNEAAASDPSAHTQLDLDERRVRIDGVRSRFTHLGHIKARLEFLTFVLTNSSLVFYEQQVDTLWQYFVDEAPTTKTTELAMAWFRSLAKMDETEEDAGVDENEGKLTVRGGYEALPDSVLGYLFKEKLGKLPPGKMNFDAANLFFDLFIHLNSKSKALKKIPANMGGGWIRQSDKLDGIQILWNVALEAEDSRVTKAASNLLIELHHNLAPKIKAKEDIHGSFVQVCLDEIAKNISSIMMLSKPQPPSPPANTRNQTQDNQVEGFSGNPQDTPETDPSLGGVLQNAQGIRESMPPQLRSLDIPDHPTKSQRRAVANYSRLPPRPDELQMLENKTTSLDSSKVVARAVLLLRQFIDRFHVKPQKIFKIQVKAGQSESVVTELQLEASSTVGELREAIADHFNESPSVVILFRQGTPSRYSSASLEKLEDDSKTLEACKFTAQSAVLARKKELSEIEKAKDSKEKKQEEEEERADLIEVDEIIQGFQSELDPFLFYQSPWEKPETVDENESKKKSRPTFKRNNDSKESDKDKVPLLPQSEDTLKRAQRLIDSIPPPLPHKPEMTLESTAPSGRQSSPSPAAVALPPQPTDQPGAWPYTIPQELPLTSYLKESPHHFDQLFSILDLNLSIEETENINVGANIWHILQSLPTHSGVLSELRSLNQAEQNLWHVLLEPTSLYKLLYSLQVVDAFLSSPYSSAESVERWALRFLHLGGVDHLLVLFDTTSQKILKVENEETLDESKVEALTLCITLIFRILQQLYGFDAEFRSAISVEENLPPTAEGLVPRDQRPTLPSGTVIHTSEMIKLVHTGLDVLIALCKEGPPAWALLSAVASGCKFMVNCICFDRADNLVESYKGLGRFVSVFTLKLPNRKIRSMACFFLYYMCLITQKSTSEAEKPTSVAWDKPQTQSSLTLVLLQHLLPLLPSVGVDTATGDFGIKKGQKVPSIQAGEYFALVSGLLHLAMQILGSGSSSTEQGQLSSEELGFDPEDLVDSVTEALLDHQVTETFHSANPDRTFIGLMMLLASLVQDSPERKVRVCEPDFLSRVAERRSGERGGSSDNGPATNSGRIQAAMSVSGARKVYNSLKDAMNSRSGSSDMGPTEVPGLTLLSFLYKSCLFPPTTTEGPDVGDAELSNVATIGAKCKTPESRKMAYILLVHLCLDSERNFMKLMKMMGISVEEESSSSKKLEKEWEGLQMLGSKIREWDYNPSKDLKDPGQYVGLRNQGATCYMNSVIQQLYHTPHFKKGLLLVQSSRRKENIEEKDTVLFQLQVLFSFLALSQKKYFDTKPLCSVFKDGGEPLNVGEQKDVNEFCGMLFDELEASGPEADKVTKDSYGGTILNQIICKECNYTSNSPENFFMLSVDIKNKENLQEALELYIASDTLTGENQYYCQDCAKKSDAVKRCVIKDLPNTLIIHLKRFEFNFETFTKTKLNDYCAFPLELDMSAYTEKGLHEREMAALKHLQASSVKKGLSIETGSEVKVLQEDSSEVKDSPTPHEDGTKMESEDKEILGALEQKGGEDYASGQPKESKEEKQEESKTEKLGGASTPPSKQTILRPSSTKYQLQGIVAHIGSSDSGHYYSFIKERDGLQRWFEFNDKMVVPFKEEDIPKECYGGVDKKGKERNNNAYLLFYDRQDESKGELVSNQRRLPKLYDSPTEAESANNKGKSEEQMDMTTRRLPLLYKEESSLGNPNSQDLYLPPRVLQAVWKENVAFFSDRFLFDNDFLRFVWNILNAPVLERPNLHTMILQVGLGVGAEVVAHARAKRLVPVWLDRLKQVAGNAQKAENCLSLLANQKDLLWLMQGLVVCPNSHTRKAFSELIKSLILTAQSESDEFETVDGVSDVVDALLTILAKKVKETEEHNLHEVFQLCLEMCKFGPYLRRTMLVQEAVYKLIACFVAQHAQLNEHDESALQKLLQALSLLVRSSDVWVSSKGHSSSQGNRGVGPPPTAIEGGNPRVELSRDSLKALQNRPFLETSLVDCPQEIAEILNHLCWDRSDNVANALTKRVVELLVDSTSGVTLPAYRSYLQVMSDLLHMRDSLVSQRLHGCLGMIWPRAQRLVERQGTGDAEFLYDFSKVLLSLALTVPEASRYIFDKKDQWKDWAIQYLNEKVGSRRQAPSRGGRSY